MPSTSLPSKLSTTRKRATAALTAAFFAALLVGGCSSSGGDTSSDKQCERGDVTVEKALTGFFTAVADNDKTAAEEFLIPGNKIDPDAFSELHDALKGEDIEGLRILESEFTGGAYSMQVLTVDGDPVGQFMVYESESDDDCVAVAWGIFPEDEDNS